MYSAAISAIEYFLPKKVLTNKALAAEFPEWGVDKIAEKTGIETRHISGPDELSSDLACGAAKKLFDSGACCPEEVDFIIFCTQTADYALPTTACLIQHRLGVHQSAGALDFNLGCSGYIYGLSLAKGLVETGQAKCVLLLTADTYTKLLSPGDKTVRTIFGDGAAATLIRLQLPGTTSAIGPFVFGTDGSGGANLVCHKGGFRGNAQGIAQGHDALWMNGPEIFNFTLKAVPAALDQLLAKVDLKKEQVDLYIFHQANRFMLEQLRRKMTIPVEKFWVSMAHVGNTVSASIPIALKDAETQGRLSNGMKIVLVGFGVGYSWGATLVEWTQKGGAK